MVNVGHQSNGRVNEPTHHIALKEVDGSNETGFLCVGADAGQQVIPDISVIPYPGQATQIRTGRAKHGDKVPPFLDVSLADFGGGMGMLHRDEDKSRYLDGYMMATEQPGRTLLQGRPVYTTGLRDFNEYQPANTVTMSWRNVYSGTNEDTEITFLTEAAYNADKVRLYLRKIGSPTGNVTVTLRLNDNTVQKTITLDASNLSQHSPYWVEFDWTGTEALLNATNYKININYAGGDATNYVQLWYDTTNSKFLYRVLDDTADFEFKMFEYKNAMYGYTVPVDGSVSKLYMLGDRGAADDNTGALTTTIDATKTWTNDEWIGDIVLITGGGGLLEETPWRTITDNNGTTLTHTAWTVIHDTNTEYVILSKKWTLKQTLTGRVHGHTVVADKVFFSFGFPGGTTLGSSGDTDLYIRRYREYNDGGTWTEEVLQEDNNYFGAEKMLGIMSVDTSAHEITIADLYTGAVTPEGSFLGKFKIPYSSQDMYSPIGIICANDRAWSDTIYTNATPLPYYYGSVVNVDAAFTTGKCAHWKLDTPLDIRGGDAIAMRININPAGAGQPNYTNAGDIRLVLSDGTNEDEYNLSGTIEEWVDEFVDLLDAGVATVDMSAVTDMYWKINSDEGQVIINVWGAILLVGDRGLLYKKWHSFQSGEIINNIIEYAGGGGQVEKKPWILTDRNLYYIEDDIIKEIYLKELTELKHPRNGEGAVVQDGQLYFNVGERVQRYYVGQLDNLGPDVDYGLPANRRGIPCTMASYAGMVLAGYDAGSSGYSHVMYRRNHGWHEIYRAPVSGNRIKDIHIFGRADKVDELFISEGADVFYVPLSLNSETEASFNYTYHGHVQTSRIYATTRETKKFFKSLELIQEAHEDADSTPNTSLRVYYKTSSVSTWTLIDDYTTIPNEENNIGTYNIGGTWIQFLIEFEAQEAGYSPILVAGVLDATERLVVKNTYNYTLMVREDEDDNLDGSVETVLGSTKIAQLETWAKQELPLILRSNSIFEDNKYVFIEPTRARMSSQEIDGDGKEIRTYKLSLLEVD